MYRIRKRDDAWGVGEKYTVEGKKIRRNLGYGGVAGSIIKDIKTKRLPDN